MIRSSCTNNTTGQELRLIEEVFFSITLKQFYRITLDKTGGLL